MTIALYRRYRPECFAEVRGQEHVTDPLQQALRRDRVNHAYLFSGPRGCGKTTSARILARALNCHARVPDENGMYPDDPCGVCPSCIDLARGGGGSLDVIEIDAASHNGVEDARDLRERAVFAPARDKYKIFIIDEAHMVTPAGFNALLKIVEEPPPHTRFLFATTEPDKVIGTIRSRTHHYPFHLAPVGVLTTYLKQLCDEENVPVEPTVLPLVARAGAGSFRDALSVLDQLMAGAGEEGLTYERAVSLLGFTNASLLDDVVDAIAARDGAGTFGAVERIVEAGHDPRRFVEDLLGRFRDLVIAAATGDAAPTVLPEMPEDQMQRLMAQAATMGQHELSRSADICNTALSSMVGATSPRLHLELLMARLMLPSVTEGQLGAGAVQDQISRGVVAGGSAAGQAPAAQSTGPASPGPAAAAGGKKPSWRDLAGVPKKGPTAPENTQQSAVTEPTPSPSPASPAEASPPPAAQVPPTPPPAVATPASTATADAWTAPGVSPSGSVDLGNTTDSPTVVGSDSSDNTANQGGAAAGNSTPHTSTPQASATSQPAPSGATPADTSAAAAAQSPQHEPLSPPSDQHSAPEPAAAERSATQKLAGPAEATKLRAAWPHVVEHLGTLSPVAVKSLDYAEILGIHSGRFGMRFSSQPAADSFTRQNLGTPIAAAIQHVTGIDVTVVCLGPNDRKAPPAGANETHRAPTGSTAPQNHDPSTTSAAQTSRAPRGRRESSSPTTAGSPGDSGGDGGGHGEQPTTTAQPAISAPPVAPPSSAKSQAATRTTRSQPAPSATPSVSYPPEPEPDEWDVPPPDELGPAEYDATAVPSSPSFASHQVPPAQDVKTAAAQHSGSDYRQPRDAQQSQSSQDRTGPSSRGPAGPPGRANPVAVESFGASTPTTSTGMDPQDPWAVDVSSLPTISAPAKPAAPTKTPGAPGQSGPGAAQAAPPNPNTPNTARVTPSRPQPGQSQPDQRQPGQPTQSAPTPTHSNTVDQTQSGTTTPPSPPQPTGPGRRQHTPGAPSAPTYPGSQGSTPSNLDDDHDDGGAELDDPDAPADDTMGSKVGVAAVQRILKAEILDVREVHAGAGL